MREITLDWRGPFQPPNLPDEGDLLDKPGVYLISHSFRDGARKVYAGKAWDLLWRISQHYCHQLGFLYKIWDESGETEFDPDRDSRFRLLNELDDWMERAKSAASRMAFFYAIIESQENEHPLADRLSMAEHLLIDRLIERARRFPSKLSCYNRRRESAGANAQPTVLRNAGAREVRDLLGEDTMRFEANAS